ncbi:hypothetical protein PG993_014025 [Apiospora rasikravindrae]|uniref:Uncharacterized protein n=1 Tax=Apiospora rasikravindrae TaxID=990691 RepID=A0ABR1RRU9_9PEZI
MRKPVLGPVELDRAQRPGRGREKVAVVFAGRDLHHVAVIEDEPLESLEAGERPDGLAVLAPDLAVAVRGDEGEVEEGPAVPVADQEVDDLGDPDPVAPGEQGGEGPECTAAGEE